MSTIIFVALLALAALLTAMYFSPSFKEKVTTSWGAAGVALAALLAWILSWWVDAPIELPPM